jgi:hypothetical protein
MSRIGRISKALGEHGLAIRGVLNFDENDRPVFDGLLARSVILIGHGGSSIWPFFSKWQASQDTVPDSPLDTWSKHVIGPVANEAGGHAVFPSDQPYLPFQQWAMKAEGLKPSPLGMLIHPSYGLWHAYRGAILFSDVTLSQKVQKLSHPCDACTEKPCLSACPVDAFSKGGYDVVTCRSHLATSLGQPCMGGGCLARRACPVGRQYTYVPGQMQFHLNAFAQK